MVKLKKSSRHIALLSIVAVIVSLTAFAVFGNTARGAQTTASIASSQIIQNTSRHIRGAGGLVDAAPSGSGTTMNHISDIFSYRIMRGEVGVELHEFENASDATWHNNLIANARTEANHVNNRTAAIWGTATAARLRISRAGAANGTTFDGSNGGVVWAITLLESARVTISHGASGGIVSMLSDCFASVYLGVDEDIFQLKRTNLFVNSGTLAANELGGVFHAKVGDVLYFQYSTTNVNARNITTIATATVDNAPNLFPGFAFDTEAYDESIRNEATGGITGMTYFSEDFESYTPNTAFTASASGFRAVGGTATVLAADGNQFLSFTAATNANLETNSITRLNPGKQLKTNTMYASYSFNVRARNPSANEMMIMRTHENRVAAAFLTAPAAGQPSRFTFQYQHSAANTTTSVAVLDFNTWYTVHLTGNTDIDRLSFYLTDAEGYLLHNIEDFLPRYALGDGIDLTFDYWGTVNFNNGSHMWFDDFVIKNKPYFEPPISKPPQLTDSKIITPRDSAPVFTRSAENFGTNTGWNSATMPGSDGASVSGASMWGSTAGLWAQYTPQLLEPGWYEVSFWNIKFGTNQDPMKMRAEIFSNNQNRVNNNLPVSTATVDREGAWSLIGTYYFEGTNDEFVKLIATGGQFARPSCVSFERIDDYEPPPSLGAGQIELGRAAEWIAEAGTAGLYGVWVRGTGTAALLNVLHNGVSIDEQYIRGAGWTFIGNYTVVRFDLLAVTADAGVDMVRFTPRITTGVAAEEYTLFSLTGGGQRQFLSAGNFKVSARVFNFDATAELRLLVELYEGATLTRSTVGAAASVTTAGTVLTAQLAIYSVTDATTLRVTVIDAHDDPLTGVRTFYKGPAGQSAPYLLRPVNFLHDLGSWQFSGVASAFDGLALMGLPDGLQAAVPASARFNAADAGQYRIWVRSHNHTNNPNRHFRVSINGGEMLGHEFGRVGVVGPVWEDGGLINLVEGENIITVTDTSRFWARFDAIFITALDAPMPPVSYTQLLGLARPACIDDMELTEEEMMLDFEITTNFPGGNVIVTSQVKNRVTFEPDMRDTGTEWFYWNFRARSEIARTVTFVRMKGQPTAAGILYSTDNGINWTYITESRASSTFSFTFAAGQTVQFTMGWPYNVADLNAFINRIEDNPWVSVDELCKSEQGRSVPIITIGNPLTATRIGVFISRTHSCESTASFALEGTVDYLLNNVSERFLTDNVFYIVPMMDIDGVYNGDQGKDRMPHDHNRDFAGNAPVYNSVRALKEFVDALPRVDVFVDFHSPGLADPNMSIYYNTPVTQQVNAFSTILVDVIAAEFNPSKILFNPNHNLDRGAFNPQASTGWFYLSQGAVLPITLEVPYSGRPEDEYTPERLRLFGQNFMQAIRIYVQSYIWTDSEAVDYAKDSLVWDVIKGGNALQNTVTGNLTLPTVGAAGTTIQWQSSNTAAIAANGTVVRPEYSAGDAAVTLTATISRGGEIDTVIFNLTVTRLSALSVEVCEDCEEEECVCTHDPVCEECGEEECICDPVCEDCGEEECVCVVVECSEYGYTDCQCPTGLPSGCGGANIALFLVIALMGALMFVKKR